MPRDAHGLIQGLEARDKQFYEALLGEDDLGLVVRAQIHIEHELRGFVLSQAPRPEMVKFDELDFDATCRLALILGLTPDLRAPLSGVGSLRNRFAHQLAKPLGQQEANNLYASFSARLKEFVQKVYTTQTRDPKTKWKDGSARDRIILMLLLLRSFIIAERVHAEQKNAGKNQR